LPAALLGFFPQAQDAMPSPNKVVKSLPEIVHEQWQTTKAKLDKIHANDKKRALMEIVALRELILAIRRGGGLPTPNPQKPSKYQNIVRHKSRK